MGIVIRSIQNDHRHSGYIGHGSYGCSKHTISMGMKYRGI